MKEYYRIIIDFEILEQGNDALEALVTDMVQAALRKIAPSDVPGEFLKREWYVYCKSVTAEYAAEAKEYEEREVKQFKGLLNQSVDDFIQSTWFKDYPPKEE